MKSKSTTQQRSHGFTLVELIIVIIVIGILFAIAVVGFNGVQKSTTGAAMKSTIKQVAAKMKVTNASTETYPQTLPSDTTAPSGMGLALATVSSANEFCINITSSKYSDLSWHVTQTQQLETGLCSGAVIASSIIGDYAGSSAPAISKSKTVNGSGGGLVVSTDDNWDNVTVSWASVANASRYEVQIQPTGDTSWYLRRIGAPAANSNATISSYQSDPAFSAQIPNSSTSISWAGGNALPQTANGLFNYRFRSYDAQNVAGAWHTASLSVPLGSSLVPISTFSATPASDWTNIDLAWVVPTNDMPNPRLEIQLRTSTTGTWYLRRIVDTASNSNASVTSTYENDSAFSAQVPVSSSTLNWKGGNAVPQAAGAIYEYRIRLRSGTITGLYSDWITIQVAVPAGSSYPVVANFTATPAGTGTASTVVLSWTTPTSNVIPDPRFDIQLRDTASSTWYLRRIVDASGNSNAAINSTYETDPAFSALTPFSTNTLTWHGVYAVPQTGQTFEYRIRQKSATITGLYSNWQTISVSR